MFKYIKTVKGKKEEESQIALPPMVMASSDDYWFSSGLDVERRIIDLTGVVSEQMASFVLRGLIRLNTINHDPITIYLSSGGGALLDGLAIYDLIRASPSETIIYATGKICSMGIIVLCAGTYRFAGPNTRFMIHQASVAVEGKIGEIQSDIKEIADQDDTCNKLVAKRTKMTMRQLNEMMSKPDHWFGVATAKKYGLLTSNPKSQPKRKKK